MRSPSGSELFDADQRRWLQHRPQLGDTLERAGHIGLACLVADEDHRDGLLVALGAAALHQALDGDLVVAQHGGDIGQHAGLRSEEHTSELQSLMRISYAVFCLKKKKK